MFELGKDEWWSGAITICDNSWQHSSYAYFANGYHPSCGQSVDYPYFLYPFPKPHSPKRQRCMASQTVFREKSLWKPAQEYRKVNSRHTCFFRPHRQFPNGLNGEQELFPCFPTCKSSSLSSPPAGSVVFIISIGKGSYVFFTGLQGQAFSGLAKKSSLRHSLRGIFSTKPCKL